jgi:protein disulfide-isomerase
LKSKGEISLKKIAVFLVSFVFVMSACNKGQTSDNLEWKTNLEKAVAEAKNENKAVLVNFTGSDWCVWCKKLSEEVFSQNEFENYAGKNLVLVKIDFPRNIPQSDATKYYNSGLAQKYGIEGFPTILLFNSSGQLVAKTGYQSGGAANYVNHIKSFL